jgi:hypothetical protein
MENISEVTKAIPRRDRAYYRRRQQNRIHAAIASFFAEEAEAGRITKKKLADLIEKNPAQITRWLSEASNYESDTISDILLAMEAEMDHNIVRFSERGKGNQIHPLIARLERIENVVQYENQKLPEKPYEPLKLARPGSEANTRVLELEPL